MFESSQFLDLYLPAYFENVFSRAYSTSTSQKTHTSCIAILASFLKFTHQFYITIGNQNQFNEFIFNQFAIMNPKESSLPSKPYKKEQNKRGGKIMEFMESNIDKVSFTFVQVYLKLFQIQHLTTESSSGKDTTLYSQRLLKALNQARLQYEIFRFEMSNLKDYDDYILQILSLVLQQNVSQDMQEVLRHVLDSQYSNLSDNVLMEIQSFLNKNKPAPLATPPSSPREKETFMLLKNVLRKKAKKIEKLKNSPLQRKIITNERSARKQALFTSPNKNTTMRHKQSHSPLRRIQNYANIKKEKPINKKRTIYYQRKNLYLPKMSEWIEKMHSFPTEITFSSSEKQKDKRRPFKFQHSQSTYDDYDNESVLVRSTPKPARKMNNMRVISQKLDF